MKKRILSIALVVAMVAILAAGSFAYFTDNDKADNVFTVGNVDITLTEPNWDKEGGGKDDAAEVYAGEALAKDPTVTNDGANPCFVRVKVTGLDCLGEDNMITYETGYKTGVLGEGWVQYGDYFYWTKPLVVKGTEGESWNAGLVSTTAPLFDQIRIPTTVTNGDATTEFSVKVSAEAVQAQGAAPSWTKDINGQNAVTHMTVAEIAEWFDTCGMNK